MENQIKQLFDLFSKEENILLISTESWDSVSITTSIILEKIPNSECFLKKIPIVSARDFWSFKILDENDDPIITIYRTSGELNNFDIEAYKGLTVSLKFIIDKRIQDNTLSIYNICYFNEFLRTGTLYAFLNALNNRLEGTLTFECINDQMESLITVSLSIVSKGDTKTIIGVSDRIKRIHLSEGLIHWGTYKLHLLPEDIYPCGGINNPLYNIFYQASGCLLMMYLFDHIAITSTNLALNLCGYRTLNYTVDTNALSKINIDNNTVTQLFQVYCWCMGGGYVTDKFSIARNILSLNLEKNEIRLISPIIDAIKSNFRVYEKENVQQYIQMRNEISNLLIDLQTKVNDIAENFTSDFKNNLLVLVSFFASVIVLGVISDASPIAYFSNHIIILSWCFLLISFFYWLYSYSELKKKTKLFHKHYEQIKKRYESLLDEVELNNIFEECNPDKYESHNSYIEWQKCRFSILWIGSIIILFIGLCILFVFNNIQTIKIIKTLMAYIVCFSKNI